MREIQRSSVEISVILPVYNGMKYLQKSVDSVLMQEDANFEFLILDDCSTDGSWEYLESLFDPRIKLFRNTQNKGLFHNLNLLIQHVDSPLIKLWSQDDIMYKDCLKSFVAFHHLHPEVGFSYSGTDVIDEKGTMNNFEKDDQTPEIISTKLHARIAFFTGSIAGNISNVCINRTALDKVGLFNENMKISGDFDMWVRLAKDHPTGRIIRKLVQLRNHPGQLSRNEKYYIDHVKEDLIVYRYLFGYVDEEINAEGKQLLRKHKFQFYYTLMLKAFAKGRIGTGFSFLKYLFLNDNFFLLSMAYCKSRIKKPGVPAFLN